MYFLMLIRFGIAFIQYDQGLFTNFDYKLYPSVNCYNGAKYSDTITFSNQFQNIPKVILVPIMIDSEFTLGGYDLEILDVNSFNFSIQVLCPYERLYSLRLQWYALDNDIITVTNLFKITNFQNYTFSHANKLASEGFISILGLTFNGTLNFSISISSITADSASIYILNPSNLNQNLLSISYQIILCPSSFIQLVSTQSSLLKTNYLIAKQCNSYFMLPINGFIYNNSQNIRINTTYYSDDPLQYYQEYFVDSGILNSYKQIWLRYTVTSIHFKLENINFLQTTQIQMKQNLQLQVNIEELNLQLSTIGSQTLTINPQMYNFINIKIYGKCIQKMNIVATYKNLNICNEEILSFNQQCGADKQYFFISSKHQIQNTQIENITIVLANSSLQINQILYGSTIDTVQLVSVELK